MNGIRRVETCDAVKYGIEFKAKKEQGLPWKYLSFATLAVDLDQ